MHVKYEAANLYFNIPPVSHQLYKLSKFNQRLSLIYCLRVPCWGASESWICYKARGREQKSEISPDISKSGGGRALIASN